jgi:DNA-binding MarR family transcriptional regulator
MAQTVARRTDVEQGDDRSLGSVLDFLRVLWALDHELARSSKRMERDLGVTGPQRLVIRFVGRFPGISAGKLAKLLCMHPSTLAGILRRLEVRRLLLRRVDARDGRRALFALTAAGRQRDSRQPGTVEAVVENVLRATPRRQLSAATQLLTRLTEALAATRDDA